MAQLSNVQYTWERINVLLADTLSLVDYSEGATEYTKLMLGSSWRKQAESNKQLEFLPNGISKEVTIGL
jgi:hypothetical protein